MLYTKSYKYKINEHLIKHKFTDDRGKDFKMYPFVKITILALLLGH